MGIVRSDKGQWTESGETCEGHNASRDGSLALYYRVWEVR